MFEPGASVGSLSPQSTEEKALWTRAIVARFALRGLFESGT